jgi:hypothetical protein
MPKLEYFLVCESVSVDRTTNAVSLFNIFEDVQLIPAGIPAPRITNMVAVCCWLKEEGDDPSTSHTATLRIHRCGAEPQDMTLDFTLGDHRRYRHFFRFQGPFPSQPGEMRIELLLEDQHKADHIINILEPAPNLGETDE